VLVAAVGVAFIVMAVVGNLFSVGPAFDRLSAGLRPVMKQAPIAQYQKDVQVLATVYDEYQSKAVPVMSQALHMMPGQFYAYVGQDYPDVAAGIQALPGTVQQFGGVIGTLQTEQSRFAKADAIPTSNLPAKTVPWGLVGAGVLFIAFGVAIVAHPARIFGWLAVAFAALLIAASVAFSLPQKSSAADTMNTHLKPVYTAQMVTGAKAALATIGAMGNQIGRAHV